jgi:hypothetical protein
MFSWALFYIVLRALTTVWRDLAQLVRTNYVRLRLSEGLIHSDRARSTFAEGQSGSYTIDFMAERRTYLFLLLSLHRQIHRSKPLMTTRSRQMFLHLA